MALEVTVQKITNYWNGRTLWEGAAADLRAAVIAAVATDAYLSGANLRDADLRGANLIALEILGLDPDAFTVEAV